MTNPDAKVLRAVSFIVPAWNEERILGSTLETLFAAAKALNMPFEVIVADDGSTDGTARVAQERGARVVRVQHRQIAATRNAGARAATGDLFVFVDADTWVTPEVLRAALEAVRRGAVGGGCTVKFEGPLPFYARVLLPGLIWLYRAAKLAGGCFLFATREAFERVGGFDETLFASEECILSRALGRCGRFVVLREPVITSGRKLRTYSGWEVLRILAGLARASRRTNRSSKGMEIWYGPRRADPEQGS